MKKAFLFLTLIFLSSDIFSQRLDSLAVTKQVDSLIKISRELTANKNFEKAIEVNSFAEKLALEAAKAEDLTAEELAAKAEDLTAEELAAKK